MKGRGVLGVAATLLITTAVVHPHINGVATVLDADTRIRMIGIDDQMERNSIALRS